MKNRWIVLIVIALAMPAGAESIFKDGPHLAYPVNDDVRRSELSFGWQVTYERSLYWSLDLSVTRQTDRLDDLGILDAPFNDRFDLEMIATAASLRLTYPVRLTTLYVGGGMGYYYMRTDNSAANRSVMEHAAALPAGVDGLRVSATPDNTFGYHATVGIERLLSARWEIFAEYRWVWLDSTMRVRRTETRGGINRQTFNTSDPFSYNHGLIRGGVNYRF